MYMAWVSEPDQNIETFCGLSLFPWCLDVQQAKIQQCCQKGGVLGSTQRRPRLRCTRLSGRQYGWSKSLEQLPHRGTTIGMLWPGEKVTEGKYDRSPCLRKSEERMMVFFLMQEQNTKIKYAGGRCHIKILILGRHSWTVAFPAAGYYRCDQIPKKPDKFLK